MAPDRPDGVLLYLRTGDDDDDNDALAWVDSSGRSFSESQIAVLTAAKCEPDTPTLPSREDHHEPVAAGVKHVLEEERSVGGALGRPSGARFKTYERLKRFIESIRDTLVDRSDFGDELRRAVEEVYKFPLLQVATDTLNRQLRAGVDDTALAELVVMLRREGRLCRVTEEQDTGEPRIICSLGLRKA